MITFIGHVLVGGARTHGAHEEAEAAVEGGVCLVGGPAQMALLSWPQRSAGVP